MATSLRPPHLSRAFLRDRHQLRFPSRVRAQVRTPSSPTQDLNKRIAEFYDNSSGLWEEIWGEHMHHGGIGVLIPQTILLLPGIYRPERPPVSHEQAQLDLIEEVITWADIQTPTKVLDVGCGIGGSARYLAKKFGCSAQGITLSPAQALRAKTLTREAGLEDRVEFVVGDALELPFDDNAFDLVWSLESGEHMPDKRKFVSEMVRTCRPGGQIVVVTWCHRSLPSKRPSLDWQEQLLLDCINAAYALPNWVSIDSYRSLFETHRLKDIKMDDWSSLVEPFWAAVIHSALTWEGISGLLRAGPSALTGAVVMPLMQQGFKMDTIRFNLITGRCPK